MGSLNCAMRGYMGKAKWKPGELTKENNSDEKQYYILTGIAEFTPTNKELWAMGGGMPTTSPWKS